MLCAVRKEIWPMMYLIVLLWFPDGFVNIILMIFSSCLEATELEKQPSHMLIFYIILKHLDVILTWKAQHKFPASCFVLVWYFVKYHYEI